MRDPRQESGVIVMLIDELQFYKSKHSIVLSFVQKSLYLQSESFVRNVSSTTKSANIDDFFLDIF